MDPKVKAFLFELGKKVLLTTAKAVVEELSKKVEEKDKKEVK